MRVAFLSLLMLQLYFKSTVALKNVVHVVAILYFKQRARVAGDMMALCVNRAVLRVGAIPMER